jgi:hypothetical protein
VQAQRLLDHVDRRRDVEPPAATTSSCDRNRNRASLTDANASSRPIRPGYTRGMAIATSRRSASSRTTCAPAA